MSKHKRLASLEQVLASKQANKRREPPDLGPVDALGWPETLEGWALLSEWAYGVMLADPELAERVRVAYGSEQSDTEAAQSA